MAVRLNRSSPLNNASLAIEAGAGCYNERLMKSTINWDMLLRNNLMDGLIGSVIYSYVNGASPLEQTIEDPEYWPYAPLSSDGKPNRLTEKISRYHQFVAAWEQDIAQARCPEELNIAFTPGMRLTDFLGTYPLISDDTATTSPGGELFTAEPKIDRGEVAVSHNWVDGYEGVSKQSVKLESSAWRKVRETNVMAVKLGYGGRLIDLVNPCRPPSSSTPLLVPNAGCLEQEAFEYLHEYIRLGGKVIFTPMIPQYDVYGNKNTSLLDLISAELTEMIRPAGGEVLDYGSRTIQDYTANKLSVHSWISVYKYSAVNKSLAFYKEKPVATAVPAGNGTAIVVGFEANYNNSHSVAFWRAILENECGVKPIAKEANGYFSLFSRIGKHTHFLPVGNASGTLESGLISCCGYTFELELQPHEGRILTFDIPILDSRNTILYSTSEIIPQNEVRDIFKLNGACGTSGKIVFKQECKAFINGVSLPCIKGSDGFAVYYDHAKNPLTIHICALRIVFGAALIVYPPAKRQIFRRNICRRHV